MKAKIFIPIVLFAIILFVIIRSCTSPSNKIILKWTNNPVPCVPNDTLELKVYVENSGSMDAYMCDGSDLKNAVYDYVSDLNRLSNSCYLYYINSKVIPYKGDLKSFIKNLTPNAFAKAGGDRSNTDLMQIFDNILKAQEMNTVSVFVSDCILDIKQNTINYFGNCQVSIKNAFTDAISANPFLGVEIIKLDSNVDGYWFCGTNKEHLKGVKRPYYIWIIGDQRYLSEFNKKYPIESILGGIKEYCAYATPQTIPFTIDQKTYIVNHTGKINVQLLVNLRGSLQGNNVIGNIANYMSVNPTQVSVVSVNEIKTNSSPYSHVIEIEIDKPATVKSETITFSYPQIASWVSLSNDTSGENVNDNIDKTTGLMSLIHGVADAYKNSTNYGSVTFELKNK